MILLYMASNNVAKSSNSIFVILISLFVILFIIISYFMLTGNMIDVDGSQTESVNGANNNKNSNNNNNNVQREKEVYNIRDNMFTYNEARAVCAAHDAKLASLEEMIEAYKNGANWCSYGWSEGQLALYPTQPDFWSKLQNDPYRKYECGKPGVNGGYFENPEYKFGANCYGVKPSPKGDEIEKNTGSQSLTEEELKKAEYEGQLNDIRVSPFSENSWSGCSV
tara:strand:- start:106 stop:774 length:669 start_codon:yes stop_codon:yes gene_type:complete